MPTPTITARIDEETMRKLNELAETVRDPLGNRLSTTLLLRMAIHDSHANRCSNTPSAKTKNSRKKS